VERGIEYGRLAVEKAPTVADKAWSQSISAFALSQGGKPEEAIELCIEALRVFRA